MFDLTGGGTSERGKIQFEINVALPLCYVIVKIPGVWVGGRGKSRKFAACLLGPQIEGECASGPISLLTSTLPPLARRY